MFWGFQRYKPDPSVASLIEAEWLFLKHPLTQLQHSMPDLQTWCCNALFGTEESGWSVLPLGEYGRELNGRIKKIRQIFATMYRGGAVKDYCQSGLYGPYCLDPVEIHRASSTSSSPLPSIIIPKSSKISHYNTPGIRAGLSVLT
jgi:hypothetical protein